MPSKTLLNTALREKQTTLLAFATVDAFISAHSVTPLNTLQVDAFITKLTQIEDRIDDIYGRILENCDAVDAATHETELQDFLGKVLLATSTLNGTKNSLNPTPSPPPGGGRSSVQGVRLPKLDLPKFSGDLQDWIAFSRRPSSLQTSRRPRNFSNSTHYLSPTL